MSDHDQGESPFSSPTVELAACQASLAFERTLISLDQSLMGAIRTSLALLTFGFALIVFFDQIGGELGVNLRVPARNFGLCLLVIGIGLVGVGLLDHRKRFTDVCRKMDELHRRGLLREGCPYKRSSVSVLALLLLTAGLLVILGILARIGPLG